MKLLKSAPRALPPGHLPLVRRQSLIKRSLAVCCVRSHYRAVLARKGAPQETAQPCATICDLLQLTIYFLASVKVPAALIAQEVADSYRLAIANEVLGVNRATIA